MKNIKTYTNPKFPNTTIDIVKDVVYGGATIHQYTGLNTPQVMNMGPKAYQAFLEEIKKDGWS